MGRAASLTGGANAATVGAGQYPAKYSFSTTSTPECDSASTPDFVAYNTGVGGTSSQASIIAYDNLYSSCTGTAVPLTYWQYNTGGTIATSPVISGDGTQLAFMQTGAPASLVILRWKKGSALTTPTNEIPANYPGCITPCMTVIPFSSGTANDTMSSPFYDYDTDTLYVGDNSGVLHEFTGVFGRTPGEVTTGGWPATVSTQTAPTLTSPIYDTGASGLVFVGDAGGYLYSVSSSGAVVHSYQLAVTPGVVDAPLVDPVASEVYVFVGADINGSNTGNSPCKSTVVNQVCDGVFQFSTTTTLNGASLVEDVLGISASTPNVIYVGSFDNIYYTSEGTSNPTPTGSLYVCGANSSNEPKLSQIPITTGAFSGSTGGNAIPNGGVAHLANNIVNPMTSAAANCSPVSEFYNTSGTATDYIFLSVTANGDDTNTGGSCTGGCVYSFNTTSTLTSSSKSASSMAVTGGTSGLIIDNALTGGGSQVYLSPLAAQTCTTSGTTGGCAIQAAQNGL